MIYILEVGSLVFELEIEATLWHYEDNSIGSYDFSGYVYYDSRAKEICVDEFEIVNKHHFTHKELSIIGEYLDDDDVKEMLCEELSSRLEDYYEDDDDY